MKPWEKYASEGPWAKYRAPEATNPAAADPEVITPAGTIKGDVGGNLALNPAAAIIGAGDWFSKINRGMLEAKHAPVEWLTGRKSPFMESVRQDRAFAEQPMKELEAVHPGSVGIGKTGAMAAIPPALLPFVAAAEEGSIGERALRTGATVAGQAVAKAAGGYLAKAPERAAKAQAANKVRDEIVTRAREAGYVFPPSATGGGGVSRFFEGLSGKAKTEQLGMVKNQPVTDALSRKVLGLPEDAPLNVDTLRALRADAYRAGYEPIAGAGQVVADKTYKAELDQVVKKYEGAARSFPTTGMHGQPVDAPVVAAIKELRVPRFDAGDALNKTSILREEARAAFRQGDDGLGKAKVEAADAILDQIDRALRSQGKAGAEMMRRFRDARKLIAKSHTVEDALVNGSADAAKYAQALRRGVPLEGDLRTIAQVAADKSLGKSVGMPASGAGNPISVLDAFGVAGLAGMGAGPLSVALPAARVGSRYGILSKPGQRLARPDYGRSVVSRAAPLLDNPYAPMLTGMFGYDLTR